MSVREKQDLLDAVDSQLQAVGLNDRDRRQIAHPYVTLIGYDLYSIFFNSARGALWHLLVLPGDTESARKFTDWEARWQPKGVEPLVRELHDGSTLAAYMKTHVAGDLLGQQEVRSLEMFAEKLGTIFDGCASRNGYTEDAIAIIDKYQNAARPEQYYELLTETK